MSFLETIGRESQEPIPDLPSGKKVIIPDWEFEEFDVIELNEEFESDISFEDFYDDVFSEQEIITFGQTTYIEYLDSKKNLSSRRVSIKKVETNDKGIKHLKCYCHERKAFRSFRADRVQSICDIGTGEIIEDKERIQKSLEHIEFFCSQFSVSDTFRKEYPAINILCFLAKCDGNVHASEIAVLKKYLNQVDEDLSEDENNLIESLAKYYYPDKHLYIKSLKKLEKHTAKLNTIAIMAKELIEADGVTHDKEKEFLSLF